MNRRDLLAGSILGVGALLTGSLFAQARNRAAVIIGVNRIGKDTDPSLGLYAAYAYSQADLIDGVRSVRDLMLGSLQADLFDVAMLARVLSRMQIGAFNRTFP